MTDIHCNESERTIEGIVLPWDEPGPTTVGNAIFKKGTLDYPQDLSRVKLLSGHSPSGIPVGHAIHAESRDNGLWMKFKLGSSESATQALTQATEKVIDSFSIEGVGLKRAGQYAQECLLKAVALVPFPAYKSAQVERVNAEESTPETPPEKSDEKSTTEVEKKEVENMTTSGEKSAVKPQPLTSGVEVKAEMTFEHATELLMNARSGEITIDELHAELKDVALAETIKTAPPQWLGQIWEEVQYTRKIVNAISNKALTSRKLTGYRWTKKPEVEKWDMQSEIHSVAPTWEEVEIAAQGWAGGNEIPLPVLHFGEIEKLRDYWRAMNESYAEKTDRDLAKFLVGQAQAATGGKAPDMLRAVTRAALQVYNNSKRNATFVLVNPMDIESLLEFSQLEIPHYANLTPVSNPQGWIHSEDVPAGTLLVGHKGCATFAELPGSPLRANALNVAMGHQDVGLFGYTAQMINNPDGLLKIEFNKSGAGAGARPGA